MGQDFLDRPYVLYSYPVDDDNSLVEVPPELFGRNGNVVEEAEAEGLLLLRVVARRPHQTEPVPQLPRSHWSVPSFIRFRTDGLI